MTKKYKGVKTLEVLEGAYNYNKWIANSLSPFILSPALEIGAGTGNISEFFTDKKSLVISDNDPELVNLLRKKFEKKSNVHIEVFDIAKPLGEIKNRFKTIYAVNVFEHIKDDNLAFINAERMLLPGGRLVILVPAKKFAFTMLDKNLGHFRRYEKDELRKKIEDANLRLEKLEFFNALGLLSWIVRNRISRNHNELRTSHVKFFDSIVPLLKKIEPVKGLPFGISLIAVAKKNNLR